MPELGEQAVATLSKLRAVLELRGADYGHAEIVGGFSTHQSQPILAHLVIRLQPVGQEVERLDSAYRHFTVFRRSAGTSAAWRIFEGLAVGESVALGDGVPLLGFGRCDVGLPERWSSNSYPAFESWPTDVGILRGNQDGRLVHELLASKGGPLYTGPQEAINELTRVHVGWQGFAPTVYLLLPDRRCRIRGLRLSTAAVTCAMERGPMPTGGIVLKGYASPVVASLRGSQPINAFDPPKRFDVDEPPEAVTLPTGFFPNHLIVALIDKGPDQIVDQREYESTRSLFGSDITIEADASYLSDLIRGGESDRVEFKAGFDGGDGWLRTLSAFANGSGGVLFFGVNNDSSLAGLQTVKSTDQVAQEVRNSIEPFPSYRYEQAEVDGKRLVYLDVASGQEKPYSVRDRGIFVRAQATTRQADRREVLDLVAATRSSN